MTTNCLLLPISHLICEWKEKCFWRKWNWIQAPRLSLLPQCHANTGQWLFIVSSNSHQENRCQSFAKLCGLFAVLLSETFVSFVFNLLRWQIRYVLLGYNRYFATHYTFSRLLIITPWLRHPRQTASQYCLIFVISCCYRCIYVVYFEYIENKESSNDLRMYNFVSIAWEKK